MEGVWSGLILLLGLVVAWLGLAVIGLARRVVLLEGRIQGETLTPLSFEPGDPVPKTVLGERINGESMRVDLHSGVWLLIFATEGCSPCHRAVVAAAEVLEGLRYALNLKILMPVQASSYAQLSNAAALSAGLQAENSSAEHSVSWISQLTPEVAQSVIMVQMNVWLDWGPQATPTMTIVRDGRILAIDTGLTTPELVNSFLNSTVLNGTEKLADFPLG